MIGLDTNILLRYLTRDDPERLPKVRTLLLEAEDRGESLSINTVVLSELVWTLGGRQYRLSRKQITDILNELLLTPLFHFPHREQVVAAVADFRSGKADFADYLIGQLNRASGCGETVTFDRGLDETPGFRILS